MAAILTPPTGSTPSRRTRRPRPAMPTLPFSESSPEPTPSFIEGATARALHPAAGARADLRRLLSATDPTVEIEVPTGATGLAAHAALVRALAPVGGAGEAAPWNRTARRPADRSVRHLHLVREPALVAPTTRATSARVAATARVSARRPLRAVVGGVVLAFVLALAAVGALQFFGAAAAATTPAATTDSAVTTGADATSSAAPVEAVAARRSIVVERGESIWTVARRLQPKGDLRQLVDALIERNGSATVAAGQHLDVTGLVD